MLARERLVERLSASNDELARIERENQLLLWNLRRMEQDRAVLERLVAEEIGWAREGTLIVRFDKILQDPRSTHSPPGGAGDDTDAPD